MRLNPSLALAAASLLLLAGCAGHGKYTTEHALAAREKSNALKGNVQWQMAQQQYLAGDLEKALKSCDNALEMTPKAPKAHVLRGRILLELGNLELAQQSFAEAEKLNPKEVEALYFQGIVFERMSQSAKALEKYQAAIAQDATNPQYVIAAAEMMLAQKQYTEAKALLATKKDTFAQNAGIRQLQGQIAMLEGDHAKAADLLYEARLLSPDDLNIQEELARAQFCAKRFSDAELTLHNLLKQPGNEKRRDLKVMQARSLMSLERLGEARTALMNLTAEADGAQDIQAWFDLGQVCVRMNDPQRVRIAGNRIVALSPERPEGYLLRAMHYRMTQDLPAAREAVNLAIKFGPADPAAYSLRALIAQQQGDIQQAKTDLAQALALQESITNTGPASANVPTN